MDCKLLRGPYYDKLSVAKSSNMLSVAKSRPVELLVAKHHVRLYLLIATSLVATVEAYRYNHLATDCSSLYNLLATPT